MVLVEVFKLVIHENGLFHGFLELHLHEAKRLIFNRNLRVVLRAFCFHLGRVLQFKLLNLVRHDVEHNSDCQEDNAEDSKGDHSGSKGGHGSPGGQHLLLELALLKIFNLLVEGVLLFLLVLSHTDKIL